MHAYFPALTSWPSLLGDMLADAINCLGFTWVCCTLIWVSSSTCLNTVVGINGPGVALRLYLLQVCDFLT